MAMTVETELVNDNGNRTLIVTNHNVIGFTNGNIAVAVAAAAATTVVGHVLAVQAIELTKWLKKKNAEKCRTHGAHEEE